MSTSPDGSSEKKIIQAGEDSLFFSTTLSSSGPQNVPLTPKTIAVEKMQNEPVSRLCKIYYFLCRASLQLTHDMIIAAGKQKEMSAKVKAVKDILFQTIWFDEIVKKFSYRPFKYELFCEL